MITYRSEANGWDYRPTDAFSNFTLMSTIFTIVLAGTSAFCIGRI